MLECERRANSKRGLSLYVYGVPGPYLKSLSRISLPTMPDINYEDLLSQAPYNSANDPSQQGRNDMVRAEQALPPYSGRLTVNVPIRYPPNHFHATDKVLLLPIRKLTIPFVDKVNNHSYNVTFGHGLNIYEVRTQLLSDQSHALLLLDTNNNGQSELLEHDIAMLSELVRSHGGESNVQLVAGRKADLEHELQQLRGLSTRSVDPADRHPCFTIYGNNSMPGQFEQAVRPMGNPNMYGGYTPFRG